MSRSVESGFPDQPDELVMNGPSIQVEIGFDADYTPEFGRPPNLSENSFPALIDTGATTCCVESTLAIALDLPLIDRVSIVGVHGPQETDIYRAQIHVPDLRAYYDGPVAGVPLRSGGEEFFALLGRDFMRLFSMVYHGPTGSVTVIRD